MKNNSWEEITRVKAKQRQSLYCIVWLINANDNPDKEISDCYKQVLVPFYWHGKIKYYVLENRTYEDIRFPKY